MTAISWRWVWMTGLIAAAIASYGILSRNTDDASPVGERPAQPGYYLKEAILTITQPDGSPRIKLVAARIEEQPADDSYAATQVRVDYLALPNRPWSLNADRAHVPMDLKTVEFSGNVEVRSEQSERGGVIRTESLTLETATNIARTKAPVQIELGNQRLNATGMIADLKGERLQLESGINGRFQQK
jgi:lipopolysaccharide export system protein LptC